MNDKKQKPELFKENIIGNLNFSSTHIAILVLLRAPDREENKFSSIPGIVHIIKELFVIWKTPLGKDLLDELYFESDNYGPYDETIELALNNLRDAGYVNITKIEKLNQINLTDKGKYISNQYWNTIRGEIVNLFKYTKINYNHLSSDQFLDKIYSAYPEYTKYSISKIADKYRIEERAKI